MPDATKMYNVGDIVEWESQSAGYTKTKRGTVVRVVPPERWAYEVKGSGLSARPHESYVVQVKRTMYWPRVKHMRLVEEAGGA